MKKTSLNNSNYYGDDSLKNNTFKLKNFAFF